MGFIDYWRYIKAVCGNFFFSDTIVGRSLTSLSLEASANLNRISSSLDKFSFFLTVLTPADHRDQQLLCPRQLKSVVFISGLGAIRGLQTSVFCWKCPVQQWNKALTTIFGRLESYWLSLLLCCEAPPYLVPCLLQPCFLWKTLSGLNLIVFSYTSKKKTL